MAGKAANDRLARTQILDAAISVFVRRGYEQTSMHRIAKASGISRRTLFNQFTSKEALFAAAIARVWERLPSVSIASAPPSLIDPASVLSRVGEAIVRFWSEEDAVCLARLVIRDGARFPDTIRAYLIIGKAATLNALPEYLKAMDAAKVLSVPDPVLAGRQFVGLIMEPLVWGRVLGIEERFNDSYNSTVIHQAVVMFLGHYNRAK